jgi:shikimate kinase
LVAGSRHILFGETMNIVLIGMPGAGKSTVGVLLAKFLSKRFVDTDLLIQNRHHMRLQDILDKYGYLKLREFEEREILQTRLDNSVIATGGSAVYSEPAMIHLNTAGRIIYLKNDVATLLKRINDLETRGIAGSKDKSFTDLFCEREILYNKYAEITIDCMHKKHDEIVAAIAAALIRDERNKQ